MCDVYLQVVHYKHTHTGGQDTRLSDSLALSFWLAHARGPGGLLGVQKALLFPGRDVQRDLRLLRISEYKELLACV